jgi:bromodomain adjacent to zinc finger domain protein 1A
VACILDLSTSSRAGFLLADLDALSRVTLINRQAELAAMEPKKETNGNGDAEEDVPADSVSAAVSEHDELEETPAPSEADHEEPPTSPLSEPAVKSRRQANAQQAAAKAEEEARIKQEREIVKAKKSESKAIINEKKRLIDEEEKLTIRLRELDLEFRTHIYTLRSRPLGYDRFGNKVWWFDGIGSGTPLSTSPSAADVGGGPGGGGGYGTGRLYIQGVDEEEIDWLVISGEVEKGYIEGRRAKEEGERLGAGEWGVYDTPEQVRLSYFSYPYTLPKEPSSSDTLTPVSGISPTRHLPITSEQRPTCRNGC